MLSLLKSKTLRHSAGFLALAASALVGGCTSTQTLPGPSPLETESGFCQELGKAECSGALVSACYNVGPRSAGFQADTNKCVAAASASNNCNPQGLTYHPEAAQDALDEIEMIYSDGVLTSTELTQMNLALAQVFNSGGAQGEKCNVDTDCDASNGITCNFHNGAGFCGAAKPVGAGQSCASVNATCDADNFCAKDVSGFHCIARVTTAGKPCTAVDSCAAGMACTGGVCRNLAGDGASCALATDCARGFCLKDNSEDKNGRCSPQDRFDPFSASCDPYLPN